MIDTSGTDDTLQNVTVYIIDNGQTATEASGVTTTAPGQVTFGLTASTTYWRTLNPPGYVFPTGTFTTTSGASPDTVDIMGYNFDPGTPDSANLCRIYGWIRDNAGNALAGAVVQIDLELQRRHGVVTDTSTGQIISAYGAPDTTDANGYFAIDRTPNIFFSDSTSTYRVTASKDRVVLGGYTKGDLTIPNQAAQRIDSLLATAP